MSETFIGRQATLMKAIHKACEARKKMVQQAALLDELIESLHAAVRQEMRKEHAAGLQRLRESVLAWRSDEDEA